MVLAGCGAAASCVCVRPGDRRQHAAGCTHTTGVQSSMVPACHDPPAAFAGCSWLLRIVRTEWRQHCPSGEAAQRSCLPGAPHVKARPRLKERNPADAGLMPGCRAAKTSVDCLPNPCPLLNVLPHVPQALPHNCARLPTDLIYPLIAQFSCLSDPLASVNLPCMPLPVPLCLPSSATNPPCTIACIVHRVPPISSLHSHLMLYPSYSELHNECNRPLGTCQMIAI